MKKLAISFFVAAGLFFTGCNSSDNSSESTSATSETSSAPSVGQSGVKDDVSNPNIVQVAAGSKDHTTLVAAVKAAELVDALSNAGPFTVFAPTNAAFEKLPAGTVGYHTYVGVLNGVLLQDGMEYDMVYGGKVKIAVKDGKTLVNGTPIEATIKTSNGVIHVINDVLLPK